MTQFTRTCVAIYNVNSTKVTYLDIASLQICEEVIIFDHR